MTDYKAKLEGKRDRLAIKDDYYGNPVVFQDFLNGFDTCAEQMEKLVECVEWAECECAETMSGFRPCLKCKTLKAHYEWLQGE